MSKKNPKIEQNIRRCEELWTTYSVDDSDSNARCAPHFDGSLCWEPAAIDSERGQECPFDFCGSCNLTDDERKATRYCLPNGTWSGSNYDNCVRIYRNTTCVDKPCNVCTDSFHEVFMTVTFVLSLLSAVALIITVFLFTALKSVQCRRLTIHVNLASAFILRFFAYIFWIPLQRHRILYGCGGFLSAIEGEFICKFILFVIMYATLASTFWMFVEGAYLVSRFTVLAMRATEGPFVLYMMVGWGVPFGIVALWALVSELQTDVPFCWMPYTFTWAFLFLVGPIAGTLVVNVVFLIVVIIVLVQKMRSSCTSESAKIWQTIKATLLLVPLLGVTNLLLFYEPPQSQTLAFQVYMLVTAVLQHSQGIFVAFLYCFLNREVRSAVKRAIKTFRLSQQLSKTTYTVVSTAEVGIARTGIAKRAKWKNTPPNSTWTDQKDAERLQVTMAAGQIRHAISPSTSGSAMAANAPTGVIGVSRSGDLGGCQTAVIYANKT